MSSLEGSRAEMSQAAASAAGQSYDEQSQGQQGRAARSRHDTERAGETVHVLLGQERGHGF